MADPTVKIIIGIKDEFSRAAARFTNGLEQIRRNVMSLQAGLAGLTLGYIAKGFLDTAASIEKTQVLMRGLTTDAEAARRAFAWTLQFGIKNSAVVSLDSLNKAFVRLKVAGIDPTNGSLQALVDSIAKFGGGSVELERATVAIYQMLGKKAINQEELRQQLSEVVAIAPQAMADAIAGGDTQRLNAAIERLVITGAEKTKAAVLAMLAEMSKTSAGAANDLSTTWLGMTRKLAFHYELFKQAVMNAGVFEDLERQVSKFIRYVESPAGLAKLKVIAEDVGQGVRKIGDGFLSAVEGVRSFVRTLESIKTAWDALPDQLRSTLIGAAAFYTLAPKGAKLIGAGVGALAGAGKSTYDAGVEAWDNSTQTTGPPRYPIVKPPVRYPIEKPFTLDEQTKKDIEGLRKEIDALVVGKAPKSGRGMAARVRALGAAIRDVNTEFARISGNEAEVWLAEWEDRYESLKAKIMAGPAGAEREAALARLGAADQSTRAAIAAGYKSMVDAMDDLKQFRQELAEFDQGGGHVKDLAILDERLKKLQAAGLGADEAGRFRMQQVTLWDNEEKQKQLQVQREFYQEYIQIADAGYAELGQAIEEQADVYRQAKIDELQITEYVEAKKLELSRNWADGVKRALKDYAHEATNLAKGAEGVMTSAFARMEDAFISFTETGKVNFRDLINSMLEDLLRLALRSQILGPLAGALDNIDWGGIFGGSSVAATGAMGGDYAFAGGGVLTEPIVGIGTRTGSTYTLAENGPEVVSPMSARSASSNQGQRDVSNVHVSIHNDGTEKAVEQAEPRWNGRELVVDLWMQDIERNGKTARAMQVMRGRR